MNDSIRFINDGTDYETITPIDKVVEHLENVVENSTPIRGTLIVVYAMSQMGKDYMISQLRKFIKPLIYYNREILNAKGIDLHSDLPIVSEDIFHHLFHHENQMPEIIKTKYAEVYKTREKRQNDLDCLHSVKHEDEIPLSFNIRDFILGQTVAYSQQQIEKDLEEGNIVFVSTTSIEILELMKKRFAEDCLTIKVVADKKTKEEIAKKEIKRYGKIDDFVYDQINKRYDSYEKEFKTYNEYNSKIDYQIGNLFECHKFALTSNQKISTIDYVASMIISKITRNSYLMPKR